MIDSWKGILRVLIGYTIVSALPGIDCNDCRVYSKFTEVNFMSNPGNYEPTMMDENRCTEACLYAGFLQRVLIGGKYCVCGHAIDLETESVDSNGCDISCSGNVTQFCGGDEGQFTYITTEIFPSNSLPVAFARTIDEDEKRIGMTLWNRLTVKQTNVTFRPNVNIICDKTELPVNEEMYCSVKIFGTPLSSLKVTSNGATTVTISPLPEIKLEVLNEPRVTESISLKPGFESPVIMMKTTMATKHSKLVGLELHVSKVGVININIYEPVCIQNGEVYCFVNNACTLQECPSDNYTCTSGPWCSLTKRCYDSITSECGGNASVSRGNIVDSFVYNSGKLGYQFVQINPHKELKQGYYFGFDSNGGQLSYNDADDYYSDTDSAGKLLRSRHFLRPVTSSEISLRTGISFQLPAGDTSILAELTSSSGDVLTDTYAVSVQELLESLTIKILTKLHHRVGNNIVVSVAIGKGTNFTLEFDFGDESEKTSYYVESADDQEMYDASHQYSKDGSYTITVSAYNKLNNISDAVTIYSEHPVIDDVTITSNTPQIVPPGEIDIGITFGDRPIPTNAVAEIDFKDNSDPVIVPVQGNAPQRLTLSIRHSYLIAGVFDVTFNISNNVSFELFSHQVTLEKKINGVDVKLWTHDRTSGQGPNKNIFERHSNVLFDTASLIPSDSVAEKYVLELVDPKGETSNVNFTNPSYSHNFTEVGEHRFQIWAYTDLQGLAGEAFQGVVIIQIRLSGLEITHDGMIRSTSVPNTFIIKMETFATYICLIVDFGDGTKQFYGYRNLCSLQSGFTDSVYDPQVTETLNVQHRYQSVGSYSVHVEATNHMSNESAVINDVIVAETSCSLVKIHIDKSSNEGDNCLLRSRDITFTSESVITCSDKTYNMHKKWTVYEKRNPGDILYQGNDTFHMTIPKNNLGIGVFVIHASVTISFGDLNITSADKMEFCTKLGNITVKMTNGIASSVTRGWAQLIEIGPDLYSTDPDVPDSETPIFSTVILCRNVSAQEEYPFVLDKVTEPHLIEAISETTVNKEYNKGGCYCYGPGRLKGDFSGEVTFNTSDLCQNYGQIEFTALLTSNLFGVKRTGMGSLVVNVVRGTPPEPNIRCHPHGSCRVTPTGIRVNNGFNFTLLVDCKKYCRNNPHVTLTIYAVKDDEETLIDDADNNYFIVSPTQQGALVDIFDTLTMHYGSTVDNLKIVASMEFPGSDPGTTEINAEVNNDPSIGNFSLNFTTVDLNHKAHVNLIGAFDKEDGSDITYSFYTIDQGGKYELIQDSNSPNVDIILYPDEYYNIFVAVKDSEGGISTVQVGSNITIGSSESMLSQINNVDELLNNVGNEGNPLTQLYLMVIAQKINEKSLSRSPQDSGLLESSEEDVGIQQSAYNNLLISQLDILESSSAGPTSKLSFMNAGVKDGITSENLEKVSNILSSEIRKLGEGTEPLSQNFVETVATSSLKVAMKVATVKTSPTPEVDGSADTFAPDVSLDGEQSPEEAFEERLESKRKTDAALTKTIQLAENWWMNNMASSSMSLDVEGIEIKLKRETADNVRKPFNSENICRASGEDGCNPNKTVVTMAVYSKAGVNTLESGRGTKVDDESPTLDLKYLNGINSAPVSLSSNGTNIVQFQLPRNAKFFLQNASKVNPDLKDGQVSVYHQTIIQDSDNLFIVIQPTSDPNNIVVAVSPEDNLSYKNGLAKKEARFNLARDFQEFHVDNENTVYTSLLLKSVYPNLFENNTQHGKLFVSISEVNESVNINQFRLENLNETHLNKTIAPYSILMATLVCSYFNTSTNSWKSNGVKIVSMNNMTITCASTHLTTFGSGFFVKPNTIDFDYVSENTDFVDNQTIYLTVIVSFVLYILLLVWARRKDIKDLEKLGATPLPDNRNDDKYIYEILVFTGSKRNSGTTSKVRFVLSGELGETQARLLEDTDRKVLQTAAVDSFIMTTPGPLGNFKYLRIWHDNSGKGKNASWYLDFVVIRDVQTGRKYEFLAHRWFAVELDDGTIDRMLPVSGMDELSQFSHLFTTQSNRNFRDGHLWLSVFLRPPRSRFTRVQRVSSCMALLYLTMLVNIMWYGTAPKKPTSGFNIGPFSLSPAQIGVGVISNLIVFPPSLLIITLFRKSRKKILRPSRVTEALEKQKDQRKESDEDDSSDDDEDTPDGNVVRVTSGTERRRSENSKKSVENPRKKKFTFPWWCIYVAWFLTLACIGVSLFFLWAYGIQFGNEKTTKWFTSLIISTLCSVFLTQPIKVMFVALTFSMICKNIDQDEDDCDDDEEEPELADDEEWVHAVANKKSQKMLPHVLDTKMMQKAREQRQKEIKMYAIAKEIFFYLLFLFVVLTISYGNRDPAAISLRQSLESDFLKPYDWYLSFDKVKSTVRFWNWTTEAFLKEIIVGNWYNGAPPYGLKSFINDKDNILIGIPILRQVRVKKNSCPIHWLVWNFTNNCAGYGSLINEEKRSFKEGWSTEADAEEKYEFTYQKASTLQSFPFWGQLDWYSGGGYVFPFIPPLRGKYDIYKRKVESLKKSNWIDESTRAVFVEFATYNAQVNLYTTAVVVAEFQPGGGIIPFHRFDVLTLQRYHTGFGLFILICEVAFACFILYFTFIEIKQIVKQKRNYFRQLPNSIDISLVVIAYAAIALFIQREILTADVLEKFSKTNGKGYIRLQHVAAADEVLGYLISFLVFLANMKFLHLLRFNKRIGILSVTMKECASDLSGFAVCLLIVFLAFVQLFYLILGIHLADYSTFINSIEATFSMMLGKFHFHEIQVASPFFGPVVFFIFGLATTLVLINILLTIVIRTFEEVKRDMTKMPDDYTMVEFIMKRIRAVIGLNNKQQKIHPVDTEQKKRFLQGSTDVDKFPEKVDKLLCYINKVYLGGEDKYTRKRTQKREKPAMLDDINTL